MTSFDTEPELLVNPGPSQICILATFSGAITGSEQMLAVELLDGWVSLSLEDRGSREVCGSEVGNRCPLSHVYAAQNKTIIPPSKPFLRAALWMLKVIAHLPWSLSTTLYAHKSDKNIISFMKLSDYEILTMSNSVWLNDSLRALWQYQRNVDEHFL